MKIGVPKELKDHEYRVGITPSGVNQLVSEGNVLYIEAGCGAAVGFEDSVYQAAGATVVTDASSLYAAAGLIVKVKEPLLSECPYLKSHHIVFTYLHLAAMPELTNALVVSGATCIGYETISDAHGRLPLLAPMSEIAGRMAVQAGAHFLEKNQGGKGVLLSGAPGVPPANVLVIGAGVVGMNAARIAEGMGAHVTVADISTQRLAEIDGLYSGRYSTLYASEANVHEHALRSDLIVGAVLVPGASAPKVLTKTTIDQLPQGTVLVDVAIDQGGCFETSRPTTHSQPVYESNGVIHYCVTNIPGAVPRTSTLSLTNATLPFVSRLAQLKSIEEVVNSSALLGGLQVHQGKVTNERVAMDTGNPFAPIGTLLNAPDP